MKFESTYEMVLRELETELQQISTAMSTTLVRGQATKILLLNPNSSSAMTDGMKTVLRDSK